MDETASQAAVARPPQIAQAGELRDTRVEALRALAAIGVVAAHAWGFAGGNFFGSFSGRLLAGIGFGALFFFALSSCLLYMPFARRDFGRGGPIGLRQYAINRAVRIFPLYYVVLVVVLIVFEGGGSFDQWWRYALFWENFSAHTINTVNGSVWTIVVELHFYLLLPPLALGLGRLTRGSLAKAAVLLGALGLLSIAVREYSFAKPDELLLLRYSLPSTFYLVAAGMMLALVRVAWEDGRPAWVRGPLARAELWIAVAGVLWLGSVYDYRLEPLLGPASFLLLGACMLPLEFGPALRILDLKLLGVLGIASYSIYLWHVPVLELLTDERRGPLTGHYLWLIALSVVATCLVALASYRLIEAPALKLRKRWGSTGTQPPATAGRIVTSSPSSTDVSSPSRKRMSSPPT